MEASTLARTKAYEARAGGVVLEAEVGVVGVDASVAERALETSSHGGGVLEAKVNAVRVDVGTAKRTTGVGGEPGVEARPKRQREAPRIHAISSSKHVTPHRNSMTPGMKKKHVLISRFPI